MNKPERKDLDWKERSALAVAGVFIVIYGYGQILRRKLIYTNWLGQNISAWFIIFLGVLFLLAAIFPWGRVHFLWRTNRKTNRH